jgi:hypothetical protein
MTQEDKELLLRDLCSRLPYNPLVEYEGEDYNVLGIAHGRLVLCKPLMSHTLNENPRIEEIKPYLFPLSSMTKEQESYLHFNTKFTLDICNDLVVKIDEDDNYFYTDTFDYVSLIDWLNKNHFDYRGLIEKGLAIDATNLNIY